MAADKKTNWARNIALIVVAIIIGAAIGWKANELSEKAAALEREGHAAELSTNTGQGFRLSDEYSQNEDARNARLNMEIFAARQEADDWAMRFIAYVGGVILLSGLIFVVAPSLERAAHKRPAPQREDFTELTELGRKTKAGITAAASSINKAIPRQPTVGGLSTADELRKWEELRKEGLITDTEFRKMRDKLVG
ncbi:SHOCT domain-containing protein [Brevundimonas intermedia]|uniref:SHOCT domain-containing protein n=1 Tax=Brevundimonas intermedia TaxID=74315 RepID=UPI003208B9F4